MYIPPFVGTINEMKVGTRVERGEEVFFFVRTTEAPTLLSDGTTKVKTYLVLSKQNDVEDRESHRGLGPLKESMWIDEEMFSEWLSSAKVVEA